MLMRHDYCIPCILKMSLEIIRGVTKDEKQVKKFMGEILSLESLKEGSSKVTAPEIVEEIWRKMQKIAKDDDPLKTIKAEQNQKALNIYPFVKEILLESNDPVLEAMRWAIAGNSIDAMLDAKKGMDGNILSLLSGINQKYVEELKTRLEKTKKLIYFGDNCGEIVFDKLLIETFHMMYGIEVIFVTRTKPILNDATLKDALSVGLDKVATVIENGIREPLPGTILAKVSSEVRTHVEQADLIISKGGGNYETLSEEGSLKGKITFLFQAKCYPYCSIHSVPLGALIVYNNYCE